MLSTSFVQTKLGAYATKKINESYNTNLSIGKVNLSFLGSVAFKDVQIRDHHKDTLIVVWWYYTARCILLHENL